MAEARARRRLPPLVLVVVGVLVGALAALAVAAAVQDDDPSPPSTVLESTPLAPDHEALAAAFVEAYGQFRSATFVADYAVARTTGDEVVRFTRQRVQRPPDRVVREEGSAEARETYSADDVAREQAALAGYFAGEAPQYRIERDGDCYLTSLYRAMLDPPMGYEARWCFAAGGVVQERSLSYATYTETETLRSVRTTVTDADLVA